MAPWPWTTEKTKHGLVPFGSTNGVVHGSFTLLKWQFFAGMWVIVWSGW